MAAALVTHSIGSAASGSTGTATTAAANTTGATLIICAVAMVKATGFIAADFSDSAGNAWSVWPPGAKSASLFTTMAIVYCNNPTTAASHTFTYSGASSGNPSVAMVAFSGTASGAAPDVQQFVTAGNSSGVTSLPSGTPTSNGQPIVSFLAINQAGATVSSCSGMTLLDQVSALASTHYGLASAYVIQTTAAAIAPVWQQSATAVYSVGEMVSFPLAAVVVQNKGVLTAML